MSYEEVIEIINEISNRIGATATDLYPKLVRYGVWSNTMAIILSVLILAISIFAVIFSVKQISSPDYGEEELPVVVLIAASLSFLVSMVVGLLSIYGLVMWLAAPEIQAIKFILGSTT